jgi:lipopolysaccharide export LptBFGC system permease protein LptF
VSFALVAALVGFALSLHGAPRANRALHAALEDFSRERPSAALTAGKTHHFGEWKLEAREVSAGGEAMRGVLLWMPEIGETVFAEAGELSPDGDGRTRVTLENGTLLLNPRERVRELRFESMTTLLPSDAVTLSPDESERLGADSLEELLASWRSGEIAAGTELHRRFALPAATLIFGLLVVPLFFARAHFSRSGGGVLGIVATVAYYGLVQLGDGLVQSGDLSVAAGVWLPNLVLGAIALALVVRLRGMSSFGRHVQRPRARGGEAVSARSPGRIRTRRWALSRYISSRFVQMAVICFSVLMVAYLLVDVLERLQSFARYQAEILPVLRYYAARLPVFASRVFPMALLVATALTVSSACGAAASRPLAPCCPSWRSAPSSSPSTSFSTTKSCLVPTAWPSTSGTARSSTACREGAPTARSGSASETICTRPRASTRGRAPRGTSPSTSSSRTACR